MNLQELKAKGGLVESAPVLKPITWTHEGEDGQLVTDDFTVLVKRQSFAVIERLYAPEEQERSRNTKLIAECVLFGEEGDERLTYEQAQDLQPGLAFLLLAAVHEVNGTGQTAKN